MFGLRSFNVLALNILMIFSIPVLAETLNGSVSYAENGSPMDYTEYVVRRDSLATLENDQSRTVAVTCGKATEEFHYADCFARRRDTNEKIAGSNWIQIQKTKVKMSDATFRDGIECKLKYSTDNSKVVLQALLVCHDVIVKSE